jgi:hypothetical protein
LKGRGGQVGSKLSGGQFKVPSSKFKVGYGGKLNLELGTLNLKPALNSPPLGFFAQIVQYG